MANLIFYDTGHTYKVDGKELDAVSKVLRFLSREAYDDIGQFKLDNASERGTAVHKACEVLYKFGKVECDADIEPYVKAFLKFLQEHRCEFTDIETPLADIENGIAGTPDLCGTVDGEEAIINMKAQSVIKKVLVKAQLNAYKALRAVNGKTPPTRLYCLQLMPDEKYRLYPVAIDDTEWQACLALHKALKTKQQRGEIT
jgi:hypothetical protein